MKDIIGIKRLVRGEEGVAIVEFAMSLIILLTMVFGLMEIAFALYFYNSASEAVREGSRYAIVRGNDWGTACGTSYGSNDCTASAANVISYVDNLGLPGINSNTLGATGVTATWTKGPNESTCTAVNCEGIGDQVTVTVSYPFHLSIPFVPNRTITMSSSSTMIVTY
jgi:Flp pilus assembly protein TadG